MSMETNSGQYAKYLYCMSIDESCPFSMIFIQRWIQCGFSQTSTPHTSTYTPCNWGPWVQLLLLRHIFSGFLNMPDVGVWVICLHVMPVLSPPTGHLAVYEGSAEHKHSPRQWEPRSEQKRRVFSSRAETTACLVRFRLFKCFSHHTREELNRAIWEQRDECSSQ